MKCFFVSNWHLYKITSLKLIKSSFSTNWQHTEFLPLDTFLLCHSLISNSFSIFIYLLQKKIGQQGRNVLWKSWASLLELTTSSTECFYEQEERTYDKWNMAKSWRRWWMKTNSKYFYCLQQSSSLSEQINSCILKIIHLTFQHQSMCTSIEDAKLQLMNICRYKRVLAVKLEFTFTVI